MQLLNDRVGDIGGFKDESDVSIDDDADPVRDSEQIVQKQRDKKRIKYENELGKSLKWQVD